MQRGTLGSHQYAATAQRGLASRAGGGTGSLCLNSPPTRWWHTAAGHQQAQQQQWQQQQHQGDGDWGPTADSLSGPRWQVSPLPCLEQLRTPFLDTGSPPADTAGSTLVVRLHLDQVGQLPGKKQLQFRKDLAAMLFRVGVQHDNSTLHWAARQQHSLGLAKVDIAVQDTAAAQQAARAAVQQGAVSVGGHAIPVSWAKRAAPPPGCVVVTIHQLPVEFVRVGCVQVLMAAAQQQGEVVAEFLGGSDIMGDAALSCPAADTVVAWVRPPHDDPLLTSLPPTFDVIGRPSVKLQVQGRPSLAPETWRDLTQQYLQAQAAVQQVLDSLQPRHQQEQQQEWQQQEQRRHWQQHQQASSHHQQWQHGPSLPDSLDAPIGACTVGSGGDVDMGEAAPQPAARAPGLVRQEQRQAEEQHQDSAATQLQQAQWPGGPLQDSMHVDHIPPVVADQFVQQQLEIMLQDAERVAEEGDVSLSAGLRQQLQHGFQRQYKRMLQDQRPPSQQQVRQWLLKELGVQPQAYGTDSDSEQQQQRTAPSAGRQRQRRRRQQQQGQRQQQQEPEQQQQQTGATLRRSTRRNLGRLGADYAAVHGTLMGGGGSQAGASAQQQQQSEPVTPAPPPPGGRGRRQT